MATQYYLSSGKTKIGPMTFKEVINAINAGRIGLFDNILNAQSNTWVMLLQHPDFCDVVSQGSSGEVRQSKPQSSAESGPAVGLIGNDFFEHHDTVATVMKDLIKSAGADQTGAFSVQSEVPKVVPQSWFIKAGEARAYSFLEVLNLIAEKKLTEQSLISQSWNGPWQKLAEVSEFTEHALQSYKTQTDLSLPDVHLRRKSKRKHLGLFFVIFLAGKAYRIYCQDISTNGMGILMRNPRLKLLDEVFVRFSENVENNRFDAKAVVISEGKFRLQGENEPYVRYGLQFTTFSEKGQQFVQSLMQS